MPLAGHTKVLDRASLRSRPPTHSQPHMPLATIEARLVHDEDTLRRARAPGDAAPAPTRATCSVDVGRHRLGAFSGWGPLESDTLQAGLAGWGS